MEFPGVSKKYSVDFPGVNSKRGVISKGNQEKIMWDFQGSWFLALEILRANTILWNIQERSFVSSGISRGKVKNEKF